ncbi:hypothetical protein MBLNU13_g08712t1 [Cladosporium sp. NU13]
MVSNPFANGAHPADDIRRPGLTHANEFEQDLSLPASLFIAGGQTAKLQNPFVNWPWRKVDRAAQRVAREYRLEDREKLFIKAARVLKDPDPRVWEYRVPDLTPEERRALKTESATGFFRQQSALQSTFAMLFVAAIVQGWNQTSVNSANLSWPKELGLIDRNSEKNCGLTGFTSETWWYAAVNAAPFLTASVSCWFSDWLNEALAGRRATIAISAILILISSIGGAFASSKEMLLAFRITLGIGMGWKASTVPVFAAEIAPAHLRGSLVMNWQVFDAVGIALGSTANIIASTQGPASWRWQIASSCLPSVALLSSISSARLDSPRFLMKHERSRQKRYDDDCQAARELDENFQDSQSSQDDSTQRRHPLRWFWHIFSLDVDKPYKSPTWETLLALKGEPILAARELVFTHCQLLVEAHSRRRKVERIRNAPESDTDFSLSGETRWWRRVRRLVTKPEVLREVLAALIVMLSQQLCGINLLIIYSSSLFCAAGTSDTTRSPLWFSWGIGLTNVAFAFPAYFLIDTRGRKWLLMVTLPVLASLLAVTAGGFSIPEDQSHMRKPLIAVFTYVFTAVYSLGVGPVPFTYSAEIFPLEQRIVGMSLAVSVNLLGLGLLILFAPFATEEATLLAAFAGLNVLAFILVWLLVPEVAGAGIRNGSNGLTYLNLDQLSQIFRLGTWKHIQYQVSEAPRILWRQFRDVVWKPSEPSPPGQTFFDWARARDTGESQRSR